MQKKDNIEPPSKVFPSSDKELEETIAKNRKEIALLTDELYKAEDELHFREEFQKVLPKAALVANVESEDLNDAYKSKKGALVDLFNKISDEKSALNFNMNAAAVSGIFTLGTACAAIIVEPYVAILSSLGLIATTVGTTLSIAGNNMIESNRKQIQNTVIDYKKQLPVPK
jgi:hypothetical protein